MLVQPDIAVFMTLTDGYESLRQDPSPIKDIFAQRADEVISDIQNYFTNVKTPIRYGWPPNPAEVGQGAIYVSIASQQEIESQQFIGSNAPFEIPGQDPNDTYIGSVYVTSIRVSCISVNVNKVHYLSLISKWILLGNRILMEQNFGLMEQLLTMNDLLPNKVYEPDFGFRRDVTYRCKHIDVVDVSLATGLLSEITIQPNYSIDPTQIFVET